MQYDKIFTNESWDKMKYIYQFMIILIVTFLGEFLNWLLPLPVPSSVYGMILLFIGLCSGLIKEHQIKETADFLLLIMPIMFIGPSVGVMENFIDLSAYWFSFILLVLLSTIVVMVITGLVSQFLLTRKEVK